MPLDPRIPLGVQPPQIQSPFEALSSIVQLQGLREQTEARRLAAEEARTKHLRQRQIDAALEGAMVVDEKTGRPRIDPAKLVGHLPASLIPDVMKEIDADAKTAQEFQTGRLNLETLRRKHLGSAAQTIRAAGYDPQLFGVEIRAAQRMGVIEDEVAQRLLAIENPAQIRQLVDTYIAQAGGEAAKLEKITTVDAQGREVTQFVTPMPGASYPTAPQAADVITVQTVDEQGRPVTKLVPKTAGATYPNQPPAPRDERLVQVIGPNGQPIWVRESQAVGKPAGAAPGGEGGAVKLTAAQQEDVATMLTVEQLAKDVQAIDKESGLPGVGPIEGRFLASARGSGGATGETLRNTIGNIQGTIAKLRGGASFTPSEQKLLDTYTPTPTDTDAAIRTKLKSLIDFIQKKRANTLRVAGGQYTLPETAGTTTGPKIGERRMINGQAAEWDGKGWKAVR